MSVWAKKWAYEQHPVRLDEDRNPTKKKHPAAKAVLVALAEFPGVGQRVCWPSQATLATMTDFTDRQVRACLRDLKDQGLIDRNERRREDGSRRSDRVTLLGPPEEFGPPQDDDEDEADQPEESSGGGGREFRGAPEESSGHEPSVRTGTDESSVEANASSAIAQTPEVIGLEKHIVDGIYHAMREANFRLPNEHFKYHLGRAKDVLEKDDPSDEEIEGMPAAFVGLWTIKGKADAHSALMEMRRQKARPGLVGQANTYGVSKAERNGRAKNNTDGYEEIFSVSGGADEPAEPFDKDAMLAEMRGERTSERGAA